MKADPQISPPVEPRTPAGNAARQMAFAAFSLARRHEVEIRKDADPEALHAYRVALRKTRSIVALLAPAFSAPAGDRLKKVLKSLARVTNEPRDLDVELADGAQIAEALPRELHPALKHWLDLRRAERDRAWQQLLETLQKPGHAARMRTVERLLDDPASEGEASPIAGLLGSALTQHYEALAKAAPQPKTSAKELHALRIEGKKLRYLLDFGEGVLSPKPRARLLKSLAKLQTALGDFHDSVVQRQKLHALLQKPTDASQASLAGALATLNHNRRRKLRKKIDKRFAEICSKETRAALREAIGPKGRVPA